MHRWIMTGLLAPSIARRAGARLILALGAISCGGTQRPADVVVFASGSDLESANPLVTIHPLSRQVQRHALYVTLVRHDSTLRVAPYFARAWSWSADRRSLTFTLFPRLRWHDGHPVTARDVAFTLSAARDRAVGYARAADLSDIDTVIVASDSAMVVRFRSYQRDVPAIFAELPIVPAHRLAEIPRSEMRQAPFSLAPVGNGPFRFVGRVAGQRWTFERNAEFPGDLGGPPRIRQLVIAVVDEATTKFAGLAAGDLDFAGIAPTMARLADRDPMITVLDYPVLFTNILVFNTRRKPFDDVRVRRAFDVAIRRDRIVEAALAGYATVATGPVAPESPLAVAGADRPDAAAADSLLDAAGYPRGPNGQRAMRIELLTVGSGDNAVEQLIQADLAERGVRVEIRQLELAAFLARARARDRTFDVLVTGIPGDLSLSHLRAMFESSQRGGSLDYAGHASVLLDASFARVSAARDEATLRAAWAEVQQRLAEELPAVWLYHSRGVQGVSSRMRDVRIDLRGELATVTRWIAGDSGPASQSGAR